MGVENYVPPEGCDAKKINKDGKVSQQLDPAAKAAAQAKSKKFSRSESERARNLFGDDQVISDDDDLEDELDELEEDVSDEDDEFNKQTRNFKNRASVVQGKKSHKDTSVADLAQQRRDREQKARDKKNAALSAVAYSKATENNIFGTPTIKQDAGASSATASVPPQQRLSQSNTSSAGMFGAVMSLGVTKATGRRTSSGNNKLVKKITAPVAGVIKSAGKALSRGKSAGPGAQNGLEQHDSPSPVSTPPEADNPFGTPSPSRRDSTKSEGVASGSSFKKSQGLLATVGTGIKKLRPGKKKKAANGKSNNLEVASSNRQSLLSVFSDRSNVDRVPSNNSTNPFGQPTPSASNAFGNPSASPSMVSNSTQKHVPASMNQRLQQFGIEPVQQTNSDRSKAGVFGFQMPMRLANSNTRRGSTPEVSSSGVSTKSTGGTFRNIFGLGVAKEPSDREKAEKKATGGASKARFGFASNKSKSAMELQSKQKESDKGRAGLWETGNDSDDSPVNWEAIAASAGDGDGGNGKSPAPKAAQPALVNAVDLAYAARMALEGNAAFLAKAAENGEEEDGEDGDGRMANPFTGMDDYDDDDEDDLVSELDGFSEFGEVSFNFLAMHVGLAPQTEGERLQPGVGVPGLRGFDGQNTIQQGIYGSIRSFDSSPDGLGRADSIPESFTEEGAPGTVADPVAELAETLGTAPVVASAGPVSTATDPVRRSAPSGSMPGHLHNVPGRISIEQMKVLQAKSGTRGSLGAQGQSQNLEQAVRSSGGSLLIAGNQSTGSGGLVTLRKSSKVSHQEGPPSSQRSSRGSLNKTPRESSLGSGPLGRLSLNEIQQLQRLSKGGMLSKELQPKLEKEHPELFGPNAQAVSDLESGEERPQRASRIFAVPEEQAGDFSAATDSGPENVVAVAPSVGGVALGPQESSASAPDTTRRSILKDGLAALTGGTSRGSQIKTAVIEGPEEASSPLEALEKLAANANLAQDHAVSPEGGESSSHRFAQGLVNRKSMLQHARTVGLVSAGPLAPQARKTVDPSDLHQAANAVRERASQMILGLNLTEQDTGDGSSGGSMRRTAPAAQGLSTLMKSGPPRSSRKSGGSHHRRSGKLTELLQATRMDPNAAKQAMENISARLAGAGAQVAKSTPAVREMATRTLQRSGTLPSAISKAAVGKRGSRDDSGLGRSTSFSKKSDGSGHTERLSRTQSEREKGKVRRSDSAPETVFARELWDVLWDGSADDGLSSMAPTSVAGVAPPSASDVPSDGMGASVVSPVPVVPLGQHQPNTHLKQSTTLKRSSIATDQPALRASSKGAISGVSPGKLETMAQGANLTPVPSSASSFGPAAPRSGSNSLGPRVPPAALGAAIDQPSSSARVQGLARGSLTPSQKALDPNVILKPQDVDKILTDVDFGASGGGSVARSTNSADSANREAPDVNRVESKTVPSRSGQSGPPTTHGEASNDMNLASAQQLEKEQLETLKNIHGGSANLMELIRHNLESSITREGSYPHDPSEQKKAADAALAAVKAAEGGAQHVGASGANLLVPAPASDLGSSAQNPSGAPDPNDVDSLPEKENADARAAREQLLAGGDASSDEDAAWQAGILPNNIGDAQEFQLALLQKKYRANKRASMEYETVKKDTLRSNVRRFSEPKRRMSSIMREMEAATNKAQGPGTQSKEASPPQAEETPKPPPSPTSNTLGTAEPALHKKESKGAASSLSPMPTGSSQTPPYPKPSGSLTRIQPLTDKLRGPPAKSKVEAAAALREAEENKGLINRKPIEAKRSKERSNSKSGEEHADPPMIPVVIGAADDSPLHDLLADEGETHRRNISPGLRHTDKTGTIPPASGAPVIMLGGTAIPSVSQPQPEQHTMGVMSATMAHAAAEADRKAAGETTAASAVNTVTTGNNTLAVKPPAGGMKIMKQLSVTPSAASFIAQQGPAIASTGQGLGDVPEDGSHKPGGDVAKAKSKPNKMLIATAGIGGGVELRLASKDRRGVLMGQSTSYRAHLTTTSANEDPNASLASNMWRRGGSDAELGGSNVGPVTYMISRQPSRAVTRSNSKGDDTGGLLDITEEARRAYIARQQSLGIEVGTHMSLKGVERTMSTRQGTIEFADNNASIKVPKAPPIREDAEDVPPDELAKEIEKVREKRASQQMAEHQLKELQTQAMLGEAAGKLRRWSVDHGAAATKRDVGGGSKQSGGSLQSSEGSHAKGGILGHPPPDGVGDSSDPLGITLQKPQQQNFYSDDDGDGLADLLLDDIEGTVKVTAVLEEGAAKRNSLLAHPDFVVGDVVEDKVVRRASAAKLEQIGDVDVAQALMQLQADHESKGAGREGGLAGLPALGTGSAGGSKERAGTGAPPNDDGSDESHGRGVAAGLRHGEGHRVRL